MDIKHLKFSEWFFNLLESMPTILPTEFNFWGIPVNFVDQQISCGVILPIIKNYFN